MKKEKKINDEKSIIIKCRTVAKDDEENYVINNVR